MESFLDCGTFSLAASSTSKAAARPDFLRTEQRAASRDDDDASGCSSVGERIFERVMDLLEAMSVGDATAAEEEAVTPRTDSRALDAARKSPLGISFSEEAPGVPEPEDYIRDADGFPLKLPPAIRRSAVDIFGAEALPDHPRRRHEERC